MNILSASELRKKIATVLKKLQESGEPVYIVQYSRPKAVLVNFEEYQRLRRELEDLEDIRDMLSAQQEPARPFKDYLKARKKNV